MGSAPRRSKSSETLSWGLQTVPDSAGWSLQTLHVGLVCTPASAVLPHLDGQASTTPSPVGSRALDLVSTRILGRWPVHTFRQCP